VVKWLLGEGKPKYQGLQDYGTDGGLLGLSEGGGLPTNNFKYGQFKGAEKITGKTMAETILVDRPTCYACVVRCKRAVEVKSGVFKTDPRDGGPEYETCGSLGSNCGIDDLAAIAKGNEICNAQSLDTINGGMAVSFAMECFENGIITEKDTGGLKLNFGNGRAMVKLLEMICEREGIGDLLAQGYQACIKKWGKKAEKFAIHVKWQPLPMHEPRYKFGLGLGYAISPTGADHVHNIHDTGFENEVGLEGIHAFGVLEPLPAQELSPAKVRMMYYWTHFSLLKNMLGMCLFPPFSPTMTVNIVRATTGWDTSLFEMFKAAERGMAMARAFNAREGFTTKDDTMPDRFYEAFTSGPLDGVGHKRREFQKYLGMLYEMAGWDSVIGAPTRTKYAELGLDWVADEMSKHELVTG
jgi:aldehyde:ferredoxin oxidoreductase